MFMIKKCNVSGCQNSSSFARKNAEQKYFGVFAFDYNLIN